MLEPAIAGSSVKLPPFSTRLKDTKKFYMVLLGTKEYQMAHYTKRTHEATKRYLSAIQRIKKHGNRISAARIARVTGDKKKSVSRWLERNRERLADVKIYSQAHIWHSNLPVRIPWIVLVVGDQKKLSVSLIALCLDINRSSLSRLMRRDPAVRKAVERALR